MVSTKQLDINDLNNQLHFADLVLTKMGLRRILVEAKRPASYNEGYSG